MLVWFRGRAISSPMDESLSQAFLGLTGGDSEESETAEALFAPPEECQNSHLLISLAALRDAAQRHCHRQRSVAGHHRQAQLHLPADTDVHSLYSTSEQCQIRFLGSLEASLQAQERRFCHAHCSLPEHLRQAELHLNRDLIILGLSLPPNLACIAYLGCGLGQSWCWQSMSDVSDI